jgi:hypothetical protein
MRKAIQAQINPKYKPRYYYIASPHFLSIGMSFIGAPAIYNTSPKKESTDTGCFFKTSFGRIFCSAKNRALRGSAVRSGPGCAVAKPLQSLALFDAPQGVNLIPQTSPS